MITIRHYRPQDAEAVGILIADTYSAYNLNFLPVEERGPFLGPFQHARSPNPEHRAAIAQVIHSDIVLVADADGAIVGVLRGRSNRLGSLFVRGDYHRQGIGSRLVRKFEEEVAREGTTVIRVAATLFAVPFYTRMGYKKSTGVRSGFSFEGSGLPVQPMRKDLRASRGRAAT